MVGGREGEVWSKSGVRRQVSDDLKTEKGNFHAETRRARRGMIKIKMEEEGAKLDSDESGDGDLPERDSSVVGGWIYFRSMPAVAPPILAIIFWNFPMFFIICCIWENLFIMVFSSDTLTPLPLAIR